MDQNDLDDGTSSFAPVDPEDEFWDADTYAGEETSSEELDEILYG